MRRVLLAVLLIAACGRAGFAQGASSALLLGMRACGYDECSMTETLLIVRDGDRVRLAARGSNLLVPRKDGFWWLSFEDGSSGYTYSDSEACDVVDEGGMPVVTTEPDAADEEDTGEAGALVRATRAGAGGEEYVDSLYDGRLVVHWVGPEWLALTETGTDDREHIWTSEHILSFPSAVTGQATIFQDAPERLAAFEDACRLQLFGETSEDDIQNGISYVVERLPTRWAAMGVPSDRRYLDEYNGCAVPREIAPALFGPDRLSVPWSAIKDVLPGAATAFESPAHDLLLVLQDSTLYAFLPNAGRPGRIVERFVVTGAPIMTEWAVGAHARRWQQEASALLTKGPPTGR